MTSHIEIKGTFDEIVDLFENCHYISIRHFNHLGSNKWAITIRHSDKSDEEVFKIQNAKTTKELREIDTSRNFRH